MKYFALAVMLLSTAAVADVKMTIYRDMPDGSRQEVVQEFPDKDLWMMWMQAKMENEGCDPYVSKITVDLQVPSLGE